MSTVAPSARYAYGTEVSATKSRTEIERILDRFGATGFGFATQGRRAQVIFECRNRRVRFEMREPNERKAGMTPQQVEKANAAEERRLWRSLAMAIKSKLDMVNSGITTFEIEFLPYTMLPDGRTFAEAAQEPSFQAALAAGNLPPMLPP